MKVAAYVTHGALHGQIVIITRFFNNGWCDVETLEGRFYKLTNTLYILGKL